MMHETKLVVPALIAVIWKTAVGTGGIGLIILAFSGVGLWAMRRYGAARQESGN